MSENDPRNRDSEKQTKKYYEELSPSEVTRLYDLPLADGRIDSGWTLNATFTDNEGKRYGEFFKFGAGDEPDILELAMDDVEQDQGKVYQVKRALGGQAAEVVLTPPSYPSREPFIEPEAEVTLSPDELARLRDEAQSQE